MKNYILISLTLSLILMFQNCGSNLRSGSFSLSSLDGSFVDIINDSDSLTKNPDVINNPTVKCSTKDPGQALVRKLNKDELENSLKDILGLNTVSVGTLLADNTSTEGFSNNASFLKVDPIYLYELFKVVEASVTASMTSRPDAFRCNPIAGVAVADPVCSRTLLQAFGRKAYRRSLTSVEMDQLAGFVSKQQTGGAVFKDAIGLAYQRILLSPFFLFRTSFGSAGKPSEIANLTPHEYATRLAYFLWNSPPDEQLLALADQNQLNTIGAIKAEVFRMLKDPKALRFNESFVGQWIGTRGLISDVATRTGLTLQMQRDMKTETETFTASIFQGSASPMDLIAADYTYINEGLARHYGIPGVVGPQFQKISLVGTARRGLITQGAFLTLTSADSRSKPTGRGNMVLQNITCTPPPPFPDGVSVTPLSPDTPGLTLREQLTNHTKIPVCAACHTEMDPVGLGLENFDQIGRFRQTYLGGSVIDPSGILRGKNFKDSGELLDIIRQEKDFKKCITKKLMTYALGRTTTSADDCAISTIAESDIQPDRSFLNLVVSIVLSEQFRTNRTDSWGN